MSGISRRILWPFLGVVLVLLAELSWWITFQVRQSAAFAQAHQAALQSATQQAEREIALRQAMPGASADVHHQVLARSFPELVWQDGQVVMRSEVLQHIEQERWRGVRMFLAEGSVFFCMIAVGVWLVLRALRREVLLIRQQSNFLSAVTHEFRSPLASIRLAAETLQLRDLPAPKKTQFLSAMQQDIARLDALVGNVLAAARLGELQLRPRRLDVAQETRDLLRQMHDDLLGRGVTVELNLTPVWIWADAEALHTMLRNLIDNALKYGITAEQHTMWISVAANGAVEVRDRGIGLAPEDHERIFEKFYRVGNELVRERQGSGLGLFLVRQLARQSGGDIRVHSAGLGHGAAFVLSLPEAI